jgi:hypothetical protein
VAIEDIRTPSVPFVRSLSASLPVHHGVPGGVDGVRTDTTGQAVSERLSDRGVHGGRRTRPRGHRTGTRLAAVPASSTGAGVTTDGSRCWERLGLPKGACALPFCSVRSGAGTCRPRGWPWPAARTHGRTQGAGGVRRRPDRVRTHRLGGPMELGCPADRTLEVRHVRHPASRCRVSAGGTDRRRRCPGECPAAAPSRKRASSLTAGMSGTPWRGLRGADPGGSE